MSKKDYDGGFVKCPKCGLGRGSLEPKCHRCGTDLMNNYDPTGTISDRTCKCGGYLFMTTDDTWVCGWCYGSS